MSKTNRIDHQIIVDIIESESRVLDLGCGSGELLELLVREKKVAAQGVELNEKAIYDCVARGLTVFHGNIETGLGEYPDKSFDYVILNQSMQEVRDVAFALQEALRVGRRVIVGFPNFAYWRSRVDLFFLGRAPIHKSLPYQWFKTPNVHFLSINDFRALCRLQKLKIIKTYFLTEKSTINILPNLLAINALFVIAQN